MLPAAPATPAAWGVAAEFGPLPGPAIPLAPAAGFGAAVGLPLETTALETGPVAQGDALHPRAASRANRTRVRIRVNLCLGIFERARHENSRRRGGES